MDLLKYLKLNNAQKQIDKLTRKCKGKKGKKVVIYGAGEYFQLIEQYYDLSWLNIVAVCDLKFATDKSSNKTPYKPIAPDELKDFDFDVLVIALMNDLQVLGHIEDKILKGTKNEKKPVVPLISPTLSYLIKLYFNKV